MRLGRVGVGIAVLAAVALAGVGWGMRQSRKLEKPRSFYERLNIGRREAAPRPAGRAGDR